MTIDHEGKVLKLTQEPYLDTVQRRVGDTVEMIDGEVYRAHAEDEDGNDYDVFWTRLTPDGEVADWNSFVVA